MTYADEQRHGTVDDPVSTTVTYELERFIKWDSEWVDATTTPRKLSERDRNYYDGIQWTDEKIKDLKERNQPIVTDNRIAPKINFVIGMETKTRVDPHAFPVTPSHAEDVEAATDALRYVEDKENFDRTMSAISKDVVIEGYGAIVVETEEDGEDVEIKLRYVPWDRIIFDPYSRREDFLDARYMGVVVWRDYEDVINDPAYQGVNARDIVEQTIQMSGSGDGDAETTDDKPHWIESDRQRIRVNEVRYEHKNVWWVAHYTHAGFLLPPEEIKIRTDKGKPFCPMLAVSAFIARNNKNMRYGLARNMISQQDELNQRKSKALHETTVGQMAYEKGAILDVNGVAVQHAKPDGMMEFEDGALQRGRVVFRDRLDRGQANLQQAQEAKSAIDNAGPNAGAISADTNQTSGRFLIARQQAGTMELGGVFDNIADFRTRVYKAIWYFVRDSWTYEKWFRVRDSNEREGFRFVGINRRTTRAGRVDELVGQKVPFQSALMQVGMIPSEVAQIVATAQQQSQLIIQQQVTTQIQQAQAQGQQVPPEAQQALLQQMTTQQGEQITNKLIMESPEMQQEFRASEIAKLEVDIKIDSIPDTTIIQHEQVEQLMKLIQTGAVSIPPEMIVGLTDIRDKDKIIKAMQDQKEGQQQSQNHAMQMQMQTMQAELQKLAAEVALFQAKAQESMANAAKTQAEIPGEEASAEKDHAQAVLNMAKAGDLTGTTAPQEAAYNQPDQGGLL